MGYLVSVNLKGDGIVILHRLIFGITDQTIKVDHKKHNKRNEAKYDNRKSNLRIVTLSQNGQNRSLQSNNTSGVAGVTWSKSHNKWMSQIGINGKTLYLGVYSNKDDAIKARKDAELKYFGEYRYEANN